MECVIYYGIHSDYTKFFRSDSDSKSLHKDPRNRIEMFDTHTHISIRKTLTPINRYSAHALPFPQEREACATFAYTYFRSHLNTIHTLASNSPFQALTNDPPLVLYSTFGVSCIGKLVCGHLNYSTIE